MPKSLDVGVSDRIEVKCPATEKAALVAVLRESETLSALTRELWTKEVKKRKKKEGK